MEKRVRSANAKVSVVVPFLNEEENLPALKERVAGAFAGRSERWQLVLVDDGSTDGGTAWARKTAEESHPHKQCLILDP